MDDDWLRELEESLLRPETRRDVEVLSRLLADDFREVGASGHVYDKAAILSTLPSEPALQSYVMSDFIATELDIHLAMLNYKLETRNSGQDAPRRTLRTSTWRSTEDGWQMFFHQATPAAD